LQRLINRTVTFFETNHLKVNLKKTKIVVFRKGGKIAKETVFKWASEKDELVKTYTYLGLPESSSGKYSLALEHFLRKAKVALAKLMNLIFRGKINSIKVCGNLFKSLVSSTLLYGAPVWGLTFLKDFENFQTQFLRRLCNSTTLTPGYILRLETDTVNIKYYVFKSTLKLVCKTSRRNGTSLMKDCYRAISNVKYPWFKALHSMLNEASMTEVLEDIDETQTLKSACGRYREWLINQDVKSLLEDGRFTQLRSFKTHINVSNFYAMNLKWPVVCLVQNLRVNSPRIPFQPTPYLNYINYCWRTGKEYNCSLCNLTDCEDAYHVMFKCPHYGTPRKRYLQKYADNTFTRDNFLIKIFSKLTRSDCNNLYYFWRNAMKIRALYLNEMVDF